jgi:hypothetical protein
MAKDIGPKPLDPFTPEEETALVVKLGGLSVASLQSYIASARTALDNRALAPTWRPRIEFGAMHAEQAVIKAQAAARDALAMAAAAPVVVSKSKKAAATVTDEDAEQAADEG